MLYRKCVQILKSARLKVVVMMRMAVTSKGSLQASPWRTYDDDEMCVSLELGTYSTAGTEPHSCICFSFIFDHYEVVGICTVK